jgi:hypothetical protein
LLKAAVQLLAVGFSAKFKYDVAKKRQEERKRRREEVQKSLVGLSALGIVCLPLVYNNFAKPSAPAQPQSSYIRASSGAANAENGGAPARKPVEPSKPAEPGIRKASTDDTATNRRPVPKSNVGRPYDPDRRDKNGCRWRTLKDGRKVCLD